MTTRLFQITHISDTPSVGASRSHDGLKPSKFLIFFGVLLVIVVITLLFRNGSKQPQDDIKNDKPTHSRVDFYP